MSQATPITDLYGLLDRSGALGRRGLGAARAGAAWAWVDPYTPMPVPRPAAAHVVPLPASAPRVWPAPHALPIPSGAPVARDGVGAPVTPVGLPTASASGSAPVAGERREVRMVPELLRAMTAAAAATGRQESEIWAEAAREWLARHTPDDDPPPPDAARHAPVMRATRDRCWGAIDVLLGDLRHTQSAREGVASAGQIDPAA
jgi:hypothetical protein